MGLLKFLFGPISVEKVSAKTSWTISHFSFRLFRDKKFRQLLDFDTLEQMEQDRIFNELVVSGFALAILMTEMTARFHEGDSHYFLKDLKTEFALAYQKILSSFGVVEKFLKLWDQLIEMRVNEYRQDFYDYREHLPSLEERNPWVPIVAIGCLHHVRRGNTTPQDPLFDMLQDWIGNLSMRIIDITISAFRRL